jgi:hypothetical protein
LRCELLLSFVATAPLLHDTAINDDDPFVAELPLPNLLVGSDARNLFIISLAEKSKCLGHSILLCKILS